jgi:hypothetical protein
VGLVRALYRWVLCNAAVSSVVFTLIVLIFNPIPACVDCEFPNAWGHNDAIVGHDSVVFMVWFLGASCMAGLLRWKRSWIVPVGITIADIATQHLGGVPWWSLKDNEGPVLLIVGVVSGVFSLLLGMCVRSVIDSVWPGLTEP